MNWLWEFSLYRRVDTDSPLKYRLKKLCKQKYNIEKPQIVVYQ